MSITNVPRFVRDELKRDESIVWLGQPDRQFTFWISLPLLAIGLVIALFMPPHFSLEFGSVLDGVISSLSLLKLIPVALLSGMPFYLAYRASRTFYVLSNKRILIMKNGRTRTVQSYERHSLTPMFKLTILGKSVLYWRAPGVSYDSDHRLVPNTAAFYAVDPAAPQKMGIEFSSIKAANTTVN